MRSRLQFYEFFAGGGMARAGLGDTWDCTFANELDPMKAATYAANWGEEHLICGDVAALHTSDLPDEAALAWASFPCQDLSLAGGNRGLGLSGSNTRTRSGTFWPFWQLMEGLVREERAPRLIVLENVCGTLTSHGGKDFAALMSALVSAGYRFGAIIADARLFLPQSRPRLFIIAVRYDLEIPLSLDAGEPVSPWHTPALITAYADISEESKRAWVWWNLSAPPERKCTLADLVEPNPTGVEWHAVAETQRLLAMMSEVNLAKLHAAQAGGRTAVGALYRRTRTDAQGVKRQRVEVRFDGLAGCLRTPAGGSSRQTILVIKKGSILSRLLSAREAARLMGLSDSYRLPQRYNDAYHVAGDGVCVPVVRHLTHELLEPLFDWNSGNQRRATAA